MQRNLILKKILYPVMSKNEIDSFLCYQLTNNDLKFLIEAINEVLGRIPANAFNCVMLSGLLGAIINDHSNIPAAVITGHLDYSTKRIFNCKDPIPFSADKKYIFGIWDGHCWVELNNKIIDISIFRTIYYSKVPTIPYHEIIQKFGKGRGALIGSSNELENLNLIYTPCHCLSQDQISGIVLGAEKLINPNN
jgi:hypothetical protein